MRDICSVEGCNSLVHRRGKNSYRTVCCTHHKKKYGMKTGSGYASSRYNTIPNNKCSRCGWEGPCDRHRIAKGPYAKENVITLCPNCHRIEHWTEKGLIGPNGKS